MSLIAASAERAGVARIFFDLRPAERSLEDERSIEAAIERAFALAARDGDAAVDFRHPVIAG